MGAGQYFAAGGFDRLHDVRRAVELGLYRLLFGELLVNETVEDLALRRRLLADHRQLIAHVAQPRVEFTPGDKLFLGGGHEGLELLDAIAQQAIVALQNAKLYSQLEQEKQRMIEMQEEARNKLARDLHDGPAQSIGAIAMRVNFARRLVTREPKSASDELYKIEELARRTSKEIRQMLFTLRPLILESEGLSAALQDLANKVQETHHQQVLVEADPKVEEQMEVGKQGVVFFIVEEAVNNARKHAKAEHIRIRLRKRGEMALLEIQDDGVGFDVQSVEEDYQRRGSLGMINLQERAEMVNGVLRIDSTPGRGTNVTVSIPLSVEAAERMHKQQFSA